MAQCHLPAQLAHLQSDRFGRCRQVSDLEAPLFAERRNAAKDRRLVDDDAEEGGDKHFASAFEHYAVVDVVGVVVGVGVVAVVNSCEFEASNKQHVAVAVAVAVAVGVVAAVDAVVPAATATALPTASVFPDRCSTHHLASC